MISIWLNHSWQYPQQPTDIMVYYNKQVFKEAGLDPEKPPRTWDEMDAAVKAIRSIGKETYSIGRS